MSLIILQGPLTAEFSLLLQISLRCKMIILSSTESFLTWDWVKSKHLITWQPLFTAGKGFEEYHTSFVTDFVRQIKFKKKKINSSEEKKSDNCFLGATQLL